MRSICHFQMLCGPIWQQCFGGFPHSVPSTTCPSPSLSISFSSSISLRPSHFEMHCLHRRSEFKHFLAFRSASPSGILHSSALVSHHLPRTSKTHIFTQEFATLDLFTPAVWELIWDLPTVLKNYWILLVAVSNQIFIKPHNYRPCRR